MTKKLLRQIVLLVFICSVLIWAIFNSSATFGFFSRLLNVAAPLLLGGAIAFILNIPLKLFERLFDKIFSKAKRKLPFKIKRALSIFLSIVVILGILVAIIFFIAPRIVETISSFIENIPQYAKTLNGYIAQLESLLSSLDISLPEFQIDSEKLFAAFDFAAEKGTSVLNSTINITASLFSGIFTFFIAFTFSIYLLSSKEKVGSRLKKALYGFVDKKWADYSVKILSRTENAFSSFITGQLTEAVILGSLCYIGMKILSLPQAGLISIIVGVTALVPVFGAWIGGVSGAFIILLTRPASAIVFIIFLVLLQQVETNLIYPRIVGKSVGVPGILVLASVCVGNKLFGVAGMLIAVPLCSVLYSIFLEVTDHFYNKKYPSA